VPVRAVLALPVALLFAFLYAAAVGLWALVWPAGLRRRMSRLIHGWGRGLMAILGLRLERSGTENLRDGSQILMFNHVNLLDLLVLAATWPEGGTVVYKQEFHRIPVIGSTMRRLGFIPIDRADRASGLAGLEQAARRVREEGATVLIAPEGTRSGHGGLLPFKKGPFHLAVATRVPVVPMVQLGNAERMPPGRRLIRPGRLEVRYLPPVDPSGWRADDLAAPMAELRARFLEHLEEAPEARG